MTNPVVLRILFGDESDSRKLTLASGIPTTVEDLQTKIKTAFEVTDDFRLQYMDADFNQFMNLTSVSEIQNKGTLKIIYCSVSSPQEPCITLYQVSSPERTTFTSADPPTISSSVASSCSDDALPTSTPHLSPETQLFNMSSWPEVFVIPRFTYEAEFELQQKNTEFETSGTYFDPGPKLKSVILEGLAQEMLKYTKYPKDYQCDEVAAALTKAHPCLGQLGSKTGFWGWKQSLKYKMQNFRTKLRQLGHPEICVNSLKYKREGQGKAAANIKKPRKAEVNYIPLHPKGETAKSLEDERIALLSEVKKRDNEAVIKAKMEKTFSHRRLEIVELRPMITEFKDRWPALFEQREVNAEFMRLTTKPLQSKFMSQLDHFSDKLIQIFSSKGGLKGQRIEKVLEIAKSSNNINTRREHVLRCLIIYLNEKPDSFFKEYADSVSETGETDIGLMGISIVRRDGEEQPDDVSIVMEGTKVLSQVGSVIMGFILTFGLIYALDLRFPENLKYTFEFCQKIIMDLDGHRLSTKIQQLKIKLFSP